MQEKFSDDIVIKRQKVIKSPVFLFSFAVWSHLAYSWPGLNYTCKVKYKIFGNG